MEDEWRVISIQARLLKYKFNLSQILLINALYSRDRPTNPPLAGDVVVRRPEQLVFLID